MTNRDRAVTSSTASGIRRFGRTLAALSLGAGLLASSHASSAAPADPTPTEDQTRGRAAVYKSLDAHSLEHVTSAEALSTELRFDNVAPTRIWKLLEHGEKVECLECIPRVSRLLFNTNAKTREISAWWLRRRVFGVFGPGEVYSQIIDTLKDANETEIRRSYAANALGEFLSPAAVPVVANAVVSDSSARVRAAAVAALQRLNNEGAGQELGKALDDGDESVRLAALTAAVSVNVFSSVDKVVERFSDSSALIRRRAVEVVGAMRLSDAVVGLVALASESTEPDADVRGAAVWALGQIADSEAKPAVQAALSDSSPLVRGAARIALRRL
jgi:HEAT repeat protein